MSHDNQPIYVTKPSLASLPSYLAELESAWESGVLTHNGPLVQKLERMLEEEWGLKNLVAVTNGTIALQLAIRALDLKGEIITTPFSWIATCSAIQWEGCTPVFADVDSQTFNIDVDAIEPLINKNTVALMPVHVFSNPCEVERIDALARAHGLKVVYDAAHAVAVNYGGKSLLEWGDVSATSFHATKIFNTGEGGACVTPDSEVFERLRRLRFFGYNDQKDIVEVGLNGKMTEVHAALGLVNLPLLDEVIEKRREIYDCYYSVLGSEERVRFQKFNTASYNYSYMLVVFDSEELLLMVDGALREENVYSRRYFYPSLNTVEATSALVACPNSEELSRTILCLPSYHDLEISKVEQIASTIKRVVREKGNDLQECIDCYR